MNDKINIDNNVVAEDRKRQLKKEHDLKWEIYQLRQRVDKLEQGLTDTNMTINNILKGQLEEMQVITVLVNSVAELIKEREAKK